MKIDEIKNLVSSNNQLHNELNQICTIYNECIKEVIEMYRKEKRYDENVLKMIGNDRYSPFRDSPLFLLSHDSSALMEFDEKFIHVSTAEYDNWLGEDIFTRSFPIEWIENFQDKEKLVSLLKEDVIELLEKRLNDKDLKSS